MTQLATAGSFPFAMLLDPSQAAPDLSAQDDPASQYEDPCLVVDTTDAMRTVFHTLATPKYDDDIQFSELTEIDVAGDTEMSKDA